MGNTPLSLGLWAKLATTRLNGHLKGSTKVQQAAICGSNTQVADRPGNRIWAVRVQIHLPVAPGLRSQFHTGESLFGYRSEPGNIRYGRVALSRPVPLVVIGRYEASLSIKIISHKTLINQCFFDLRPKS